MCIIVYKPAGKTIVKKTLKTCFENNPDGAGFMFPCEGKVTIRKGYFTFNAFWGAWEKTAKVYGDTLPVVFHFRIATAGAVDKTNCHPHRIAKDLAFVHNGILGCINVPQKSKVSDTILYRDVYLQDMTARSLRESSLFLIMGDQIGHYNKFVFLNGRGQVAFANEESGLWDKGVWYSNAGYLPKSASWSKGGTGKLASDNNDDWDAYPYCEFCGKDLDTPEERKEGLCYSCLYYEDDLEDVVVQQECGGCKTPLTTEIQKLAGWCDDCGKIIYGDEWSAKLEDMAAESEKGEALDEYAK